MRASASNKKRPAPTAKDDESAPSSKAKEPELKTARRRRRAGEERGR